MTDGMLRGVPDEEMKLTYVSQSVVRSIVQKLNAVLGIIKTSLRSGESKSVLLVEYRPCLRVDFAAREEEIDHRRRIVWLDTIGL